MNISKIYLLNVPLENDYKNTLYFANATAQYNYFKSKVVASYEYENFTYIRKDGTLRIPVQFDNLYNVNYVMYQNSAYSNKWFYAFLNNFHYVNDGMSEGIIELDVIQTWMFDYTLKSSFVEREHVTDDTIGNHTIPEGLATGDYVCSSKTSLYTGGNTCYICLATSFVPSEVSINTRVRQYNGIYSGVNYLVFETPLACSNLIYAFDLMAKADAITSIFMIPTSLTGQLTFTTYNIDTGVVIGYDEHGDPIHRVVTTNLAVPPYNTEHIVLNNINNITKPNTLNGYSPRNNKMWVAPYNYFFVSNNVGTDVEFHYEDFTNNQVAFKTIGSLTPGCSIKCFPLNYKKLADTNTSMNSYNYGISGAKYPICSWSSDVYTNWLTQNGINIGIGTLNATQTGYLKGGIEIASGLIGLMAGSPTGLVGVGSGVGDIVNTMQEDYRHSLIPDSANGNLNSGDITFSSGNMDIPLYKMTIKYEYARVIDQFFTAYGYKVNEFKIPNSNHRERWWYTKTLVCNLDGNLPQNDIDKIKACYNQGITFWRNASEIENYSLSNNIL